MLSSGAWKASHIKAARRPSRHQLQVAQEAFLEAHRRRRRLVGPGVGIFLGGSKKKDGRAASAMASGQQIEVGDLLTNSKGGRFLFLRGADGAPPCWQSSEWLKIIEHPATYGDQQARRVNVCFEPDAAAADFFAGLERELVDRLAAKSAHKPKIFNKALARSEIETRMQSCLKTSQRGRSFLKGTPRGRRLRARATWRAGWSRRGWSCGRSGSCHRPAAAGGRAAAGGVPLLRRPGAIGNGEDSTRPRGRAPLTAAAEFV